ncbi:RE1-silencing transcription factor [Pholidichthys leucotaenia]
MAAQTMFSLEMFPVGVTLMEDGQSLNDMPRSVLPAPQLVMLANVAAVTAAESGAGCDSSVADEKEMMELKTVGSSYSDSEDEGVVRYSYDSQNDREVCIVNYHEHLGSDICAVVVGNHIEDEDRLDQRDKAQDLSRPPQPTPSPSATTPQQGTKRKDVPPPVTEGAKKKKPFHCKPCNFQGENEQEFVEHLSTHSLSKMMVGNRVEGRSKTKAKEVEVTPAPSSGGEAETSNEASGDIKGLIRCERCGYNTNRYDHYVAHLKHHNKEGEDHRVFKCTLCPYTTVSQYHWRKHLRNHFPSKLHTCSQCSYFSDRKSNYIQHIRTHTGVRPFQCPYCDYSSSQKTHLTRHMRTHSGERPFKCESCPYLAANQHEVTRHARQVHNGPKPLSCPYCEYKTADRSNYKKHVELHLNPRQFLCPLCKYAASKKCNLQYHIKSRHAGCDVDLDVSKVKLRVKKPGADGAEENTDSRATRVDNSSSVEEDFDMDDDDRDEDLSPINLSIKNGNRPVQSETPEQGQKKSTTGPSEKEKVQKVKDKVDVEKRVMTRQKKVNESLAAKSSVKETQMETVTAAEGSGSKLKRRVRKPPAEKTIVQEQLEEQTSENTQTQTEKLDQQKPETKMGRQKVAKENQKTRSKKEREQPKNRGGKERKNVTKPRKSGSKKSEKSTEEHLEEPPQKPDTSEKSQKEKAVKEKTLKRKAMEALDLSKKSSSETPSKTRRVKVSVAEELLSKPRSGDANKKTESAPKAHKTSRQTPAKQKKPRKSNKKSTSSQPAMVPTEGEAISEAPGASVQVENLTPITHTEPTEDTPVETSTSEDETTQPEPEKIPEKPSETAVESPTGSSGEITPSPAEDHPEPTFLKPTSPPPLVLLDQQSKPSDPEDDEGIHSSHEGGSDISDSASEGSDDSGLNGNGAGSGKMPNDPETPTEELPTPTELKTHMCIFCDRTFPLEVAYRRHLNRHLVNVYYMDNGDTAQK